MDSLRALAALLVVWTHVSETFATLTTHGLWMADLAHAMDFGRAGVVTFFAISGFVIPSSLRPGPRAIRTFVIRRLFRLYPAYWLSVPLGVVTSWWLWNKPVTTVQFLANLTMIQEALGFVSIEGLYWTLQTELVFYAACVALFQLGSLHSNTALRWLILVLTVLFPLGVRAGWPNAAFLGLHLSIMFWGALWRRWQQGEPVASWDRALLWIAAPGWVAASAVTAVVKPAILHFPLSYALGLGLFALGTTVLPLHVRPLARIGEISYSLYLFHPVVFYAVLWLLRQYGPSWLQHVNLGVYVAAIAALSVGVAAVVHTRLELPAIEMGKRLTRD